MKRHDNLLLLICQAFSHNRIGLSDLMRRRNIRQEDDIKLPRERFESKLFMVFRLALAVL